MKISLLGAERLTEAERRRISASVRAALGRRAKTAGELVVTFVTDARIRKINAEHLGHDYATDVIAFPYEEEDDGFPALPGQRTPFGEIFIALGVARRQAREMKHPLLTELLTLTVHGTLHLVGYDDLKPADKKRMFARQDRIVNGLVPKLTRGQK